MPDERLEPFTGIYDWFAAFEQNPDQPVFDVPLEMITFGASVDCLLGPVPRRMSTTGGQMAAG